MMNERELQALIHVLDYIAEMPNKDPELRQKVELLAKAYEREWYFDKIRFGIKTTFWLFAIATLFFMPELVARAVQMNCHP